MMFTKMSYSGLGRFATLLALSAAATLTAATPALAQDGVPYGYEDCGFKDYVNGGWTDDPEAGVFLQAFARDMTCTSARRAVDRVNFNRGGPSRPGYRCMYLENSHEYADIRCRKVGGKATFRFQTGA